MNNRDLFFAFFMTLLYLLNVTDTYADSNAINKIILKKDIPLSNQLTCNSTIYVILYDFDLNDSLGKTPVAIPSNSILEFNGGSLRNGSVIGNNTTLSGYISIRCDVYGTFTNDSFHSTWFGMDEDKKDVSERLSNVIKCCTKNGIELIIDTNLNITHGIEIYPGEDNRTHAQGPMIRGRNIWTTINVNGEMDYAIKIVKNKSPLTAEPTFSSYSFYKYGHIKQLTFNVNKKIEAVLCLVGWWNGDINQFTIQGNWNAAYGILFPYYNQVKNVDFYASACLNIHNIAIYKTTKYGIANYNINGAPYLRLFNFTVEQNGNGVLCNSSGWLVSEGSLSCNTEYGLQMGGDCYTARNNEIRHVEFDGNGKAAVYLYRSSNNTYSNNHFVSRSLYGKDTQTYSYYINPNYINICNEFINDRFTRNASLRETIKVAAFVYSYVGPNICKNIILNPYFDENIELSYNERLNAFYSEKPEKTMFRQEHNLNNEVILGSKSFTKRK